MSARLLVDWQRCRGRGLCYELLPELITADPWGYPIVSEQVDPVAEATEAVRGCPHQALALVAEKPLRNRIP